MGSSSSAEILEMAPWKFYLSQNYPNPFKERTLIKYCVAYKTRVVLTIYNSEWKEIEILVDKEQHPGTYEVEFAACNSHDPTIGGGNPVGVTYFYRLVAGNYKNEKKMLLQK